jgi:hypothetical protein
MQFSVDISVLGIGKYRKLVLTGVFCRYSRRRAGLERIYVVGLEIVYVFLDPLASAKGWNVEPNGTTGPH